MGKLINIDNGGTLTDIWVLDGEVSYHTKTITTPYDLSRCFFEGLKKISEDIYGQEDLAALLQSTDHIRYSTTQGTNALVERKGPKLGLLLTSADRDWLCEDEHQRGLLEALVGERISLLDLDIGEIPHRPLTEAVNTLTSAGASRIVVACTGEHYVEEESRLRRAILRAFPRHLLGSVPVLYSSVLCRNLNPNVRLWTALFNAFLHPAMERFLYNTENELNRYRTRNPLLVYRNDGYSGRVAKTVAIKTYSSGPRGGAEGALAYSRHYGFDRVLTVDVGGTTTDIGMVADGRIADNRRGLIEGVRCDDALAEIVSVGVGGGSIIVVREGVISVGPESVGGAPGPACFGMGGEHATITDALLVMGLLDPKTYFGGKLNLKKDKAVLAIERNVAGPLGLEVADACRQMLEAWAQRIADGIAAYTDITEGTLLMAFGGAGPMGVTAVADCAGISSVLIPKLSAVFSAHGIGFSDIAHAATEPADGADAGSCRQVLERLRERVFRDMSTEGYEPGECELEVWYESGDSHCPLPSATCFEGALDLPSGELLLGVRAIRRISHARLPAANGAVVDVDPVAAGLRALSTGSGQWSEVPVYRVEDQRAGATAPGPAVIEESFWTCNVPADWTFAFTVNGDIHLTKRISRSD